MFPLTDWATHFGVTRLFELQPCWATLGLNYLLEFWLDWFKRNAKRLFDLGGLGWLFSYAKRTLSFLGLPGSLSSQEPGLFAIAMPP